MRNLKLTIEYDGTDFCGWQYQPDDRTVQGEIEAALRQLTGTPHRLLGAGRTDAGVHATGQVASFKTETDWTPQAFHKGLNATLPRDVRILDVQEMDLAFNPRYDATRRVYRYRLARRPLAVGRRYAWAPRLPFDLEPMKVAARGLVGEHDFRAFAKTGDKYGRFDSVVYDVRWFEDDPLIVFEIEAIRYFHNMIRIIMGTLMEVGRGRMAPEDFKHILDTGDRGRAGETAPPHGLCLHRVIY